MRAWLHLLAAIVLLSGCQSRDGAREGVTACDGDSQARELAGAGAIDCGVVRVDRDPSPVDACVLDAFRRGQAFVARYDRRGIDSESARLLAFRDGTYFELYWDTIGGCSDCGPRVIARTCHEPVETDTTPPDGGFAEPPLPLSCATTPESETVCGE